MSKRLPSIVLFLIAGALLIYTASQTLNLLKVFLPPEQAPLAYLALVAFDGGLLGWSYFFAKGARGSWQRSIAAIMIVVSIAAVVIGFGAETFFTASKKGMVVVTPDMATTVVWAVCGVIAANVVAIVITHLSSPEHRKAMAEEEANDVIEDAVIEAIKKCAPMTARQIAPHKVTQWVEQQVQFHLPTQTMQALPAGQPTKMVDTTATPLDAEPEKKPSWMDRAKQLFGAGEVQPEPAQLADTAPLAAVQDDNARMSALVEELRELVARDKANGFNLDHFAEDLKALVNNTPPSGVVQARGLKQPLPSQGAQLDPSQAPLDDQANQ